jgi:DNA-cytosine methyltransferase
MKVLSLFDGISVLRCALGDKKIDYHAAEIDKYAIEVSKKNYPDIVRLGDVKNVKDISGVYLLCGGSPCQDLSISKKGREGLKGNRSKLFWEWVRIWKESKPKYFILENVASMPKTDRDIITAELGVQPIMIDAALVSAQSRKRLFWTNIPVVGLPADKGIKVKDILEPDAEADIRMLTKDGKTHCIDANYYKGSSVEHSIEKGVRTQVGVSIRGHKIGEEWVNKVEHRKDDKVSALTQSFAGKLALVGELENKEVKRIRKLTPLECERLQSLPDGYTSGISATQRYKCLGNAFNCEVIKFILSFMPPEPEIISPIVPSPLDAYRGRGKKL